VEASEEEGEVALLARLKLPTSYLGTWRVMTTPEAATPPSARMLCRAVDFDGDEDAMLGPEDVDVRRLLLKARTR
jgi:hypothetical protein